MMHSAALAALGFVLFAEPRTDAVPELSLDLDPCVSVPAARVLAQTALELDVRVVPPAKAAPNATRVRVSCVESHLQLQVADPITGKHLERTLALTTDEVEAGYVLRSVSGQVEGGSPVSIDGGWVAGSVGLGWGQ